MASDIQLHVPNPYSQKITEGVLEEITTLWAEGHDFRAHPEIQFPTMGFNVRIAVVVTKARGRLWGTCTFSDKHGRYPHEDGYNGPPITRGRR